MLLLYLLSIVMGLGTIVHSLKLHKKYPLPYLSYYFYYVIAFMISTFLNLAGRYLAFSILKGPFPQSQVTINLVFGFLIFPFLLTALYLFLQFMSGLAEKRIPPWFKNLYAALSALVILGLILLTKNYLATSETSPIERLTAIGNSAVTGIYLAVSAFFFFAARSLRNEKKRKLVRAVSLLYFAVIFAGLILPFREFIYSRFPDIKPLPTALIMFGLNLPPLFYLWFFLKKNARDVSPQLDGNGEVGEFCEKYRLSRREQEILQLLLQGKSYRDIEKSLFISLNTVKNHVYNIYHKVGVKNRLQIPGLLRDFYNGKG